VLGMNTPDIIAVKTRAHPGNHFLPIWSARPVVNFGFAAVCPPMFVIEADRSKTRTDIFFETSGARM
jgi:hypothetical protein